MRSSAAGRGGHRRRGRPRPRRTPPVVGSSVRSPVSPPGPPQYTYEVSSDVTPFSPLTTIRSRCPSPSRSTAWLSQPLSLGRSVDSQRRRARSRRAGRQPEDARRAAIQRAVGVRDDDVREAVAGQVRAMDPLDLALRVDVEVGAAVVEATGRERVEAGVGDARGSSQRGLRQAVDPVALGGQRRARLASGRAACRPSPGPRPARRAPRPCRQARPRHRRAGPGPSRARRSARQRACRARSCRRT